MDPITIPDWLSVVVAIGAIVALLGYLIGQWKKGTAGAESAAATAYKLELEAVTVRSTRLEHDLAESRAEVSRLGGVVEQLRAENAELRGLVMGEKVPPAMLAAMQTVAAESISALTSALQAEFMHLRQDLDEKTVPSDGAFGG